jgi:hypothetical protein
MKNPDRTWIWHPTWKNDSSGSSVGGLVKFRKTVKLESVPTDPVVIEITADTKYKLFINSNLVHQGPVKGDPQLWFYDELDIQKFLRPGTNTIFVQVLRLHYGTKFGTSFPRSSQAGLTIKLQRPVDFHIDIDSSSRWQTSLDTATKLIAHKTDYFLHICEATDISSPENGSNWVAAQELTIFTKFGLLPPWKLSPRLIPFHRSEPVQISAIHNLESSLPPRQWTQFFLDNINKSPLCLPANSKHHLELEFEKHTTCFVSFHFLRTFAVNSIKITFAECYEDSPADMSNPRKKGIRNDTSKRLVGFSDSFIFGGHRNLGNGPDDSNHDIFEPFHFRTFRFIALDIEVGGDTNLVFTGAHFTRTAYPLDVKATFDAQSPSPSFTPERLWSTSITTLENCMHDCYEDCPFYEQLQYAQDLRSSALFTYYVSNDDCLARQALLQLHNSFQPSIGLTASRAPSAHLQIIPNFSLYWICAVTDHYEHYGDAEFVEQFLPVCEAVLEHFRRRIDPEVGLIHCYNNDDYWDFVDWTQAWNPMGIPPATKKSGFQTFANCLYGYSLERLSRTVRHMGRLQLSIEYEARSKAIAASIREHCFDGSFFTDGLYRHAQHGLDYSQHIQIWAVLCHAIEGQEANILLCDTFNRNDFIPTSTAMDFYKFRAVSMVGGDLYNSLFFSFWQPWNIQLQNGLTTWVEDSINQRSDCHAWGCVPLYEFLAEVAGLTPAEPGWKSLRFRPRLTLLPDVDSTVPIPGSGTDKKPDTVHIQWRTLRPGLVRVSLDIKCQEPPSDRRILVTLPNGTEKNVVNHFASEVLIPSS